MPPFCLRANFHYRYCDREFPLRALLTAPALIEGFLSIGTKIKLAGRVDEGLAHYKEATEICESYGPAYYNTGVVHSEAKDVRAFSAIRQICLAYSQPLLALFAYFCCESISKGKA